MVEYISREAVLDLARKGRLVSNGNFKAVCENIKSIPAADVQPVKRGRWMSRDDGLWVRCSSCNAEFLCWRVWPANYCPQCGAKMEG